MAGHVAHFAVNADNVTRAQQFYANVFGWKFHAYGPPGFFMVETAAPPAGTVLHGSLQQRREIVAGVPMRGFECTLAVDDVHATAKAVEANGGSIVMQICTLAGVGQLMFFQDTEGNIAGAMQFDPQAE